MIGVIGGMGPAATVDFLAKVIAETPARDDSDHVPMLISCDPRIPLRPAAILHGTESPLPRLLDIRDRLLAAGATALVMPCNTAHHWYRELSVDCPVPFLSIVEAGCDAATRVTPQGGTVGIAATRATLAARLFDAPLARRGLKTDLPGEDELQRWLLPAIAAVKAGQIAAGSALLDQLLDSFAARGTTHVLLACTELPIALAASVRPRAGVCIDSTLALARLTVSFWRERGESSSGQQRAQTP